MNSWYVGANGPSVERADTSAGNAVGLREAKPMELLEDLSAPDAAPEPDAEAGEPTYAGFEGVATAPGSERSPVFDSDDVATVAFNVTRKQLEAMEANGDATLEQIGRVLDERYRVLEVLAKGAMGTVYLAEHLRLQKQVALKMIRSETVETEDVVVRFEREAKVTALLDHPHIVCAMDYGKLPEGGAYLVSQLVRGRRLDELLAAGALPWPVACDICGQLADALAAAHKNGIVHRDLKPDNVLLETQTDETYFARVLDFGIARVSDDASQVGTSGQALTRPGTVLGTPGYMAPEQAIGGIVDERADLYSLGVILWEALSGKRLWPAESLEALFKLQLTQEPQPIGAVTTTKLPDGLSELVDGLLQRSADKRKLKAAEVCNALKRLAKSGGPVVVREPAAAPVTRVDEEPAAAPGTPASVNTAEVLRPAPSASSSRLGDIVSGIGTKVSGLGALLEDALSELRERKPGRALLIVGGALLVVLTLFVVLALRCSSGGVADEDADEVEEPEEAKKSGLLSAIGLDAEEEEELEPATEPPTELLAEVEKLFAPKGVSSADRKEAVATILEHKPENEVPAYVRLSAEFEGAHECEDKLEAILAMEEELDPRMMPVLRRLQWRPKDTCNDEDCWGCLRKDLRRVIVTLKKQTKAAGG